MDPVDSSRLLQNPQNPQFQEIFQKISKKQKQKSKNKNPKRKVLDLLASSWIPRSSPLPKYFLRILKILRKLQKIQENPQNPRNQKGHPKKDEPSEPTTNQQPDVLSKDRRPP